MHFNKEQIISRNAYAVMHLLNIEEEGSGFEVIDKNRIPVTRSWLNEFALLHSHREESEPEHLLEENKRVDE